MTVSVAAPRGTFRDPAGSLYFDETKVFRHVRPAFVAEAESFLDSPLARKWMERGRMVSTVIAGREADGSLAARARAHRVSDISVGVDARTVGRSGRADARSLRRGDRRRPHSQGRDAAQHPVSQRGPGLRRRALVRQAHAGKSHLACLRPVRPHISAAAGREPLSRMAARCLH